MFKQEKTGNGHEYAIVNEYEKTAGNTLWSSKKNAQTVEAMLKYANAD